MNKTTANALCAITLCVVLGFISLPGTVRADQTHTTSSHNAEYTLEVMETCAAAVKEALPADASDELRNRLYSLCLMDNNAVI